MDIKQIQDLIRFVSKSGVNEVSIEQENFKITIKTNQVATVVNATIPDVQQFAAAGCLRGGAFGDALSSFLRVVYGGPHQRGGPVLQ